MLPSFRIAPLNLGDGPPSEPHPQNDFAAFETLYNGPPLARESNNDHMSIHDSQSQPAEVKTTTSWTFPFLLNEQFHEYKVSRPIDTLWSLPMMVFLVYDIVYNITHLNFGYLQQDGPYFIAAFALWLASMIAFVATRWARSIVASHDATRYCIDSILIKLHDKFTLTCSHTHRTLLTLLPSFNEQS